MKRAQNFRREMPRINQNNFGNMRQMQDFNNGQIYTKGYEFNTQAGQVTQFPIQLGGKCRRLWGINLFVPVANINDDDIISLTVNSEIIIEQVNWKAYSPSNVNNMFKQYQYFEIPRALSGSDDVQLTVRAVGSHKLYPVFYLSNDEK